MSKQENKNRIVDQVMQKIEKDHVKPRSPWVFRLKRTFVVLLGVLSVILGVLAVAGIIYHVTNIGWGEHRLIENSFGGFLLRGLPFIWIGVLVLFSVLAFNRFRHTERGYRFSFAKIAIVTLVVTVLLGGVTYAAGFGDAIDRAMSRAVPIHRHVQERIEKNWFNPEAGRIMGQIEIVREREIVLIDKQGDHWNIEASKVDSRSAKNIQAGNKVRVVGYLGEGENNFIACHVLPFEIKGPKPPKSFHNISRQEAQVVKYQIKKRAGERKLETVRSKECRGLQPTKENNIL